MTRVQDLFVVEYSPSQRCFHIEPILQACAMNIVNILRWGRESKGNPDYLLIGLAPTREEASMLLRNLRDRIQVEDEVQKGEAENGDIDNA